MNSANLRAHRATKLLALADLDVRAFKKHVVSVDDPLLRRWERIVQEIRA